MSLNNLNNNKCNSNTGILTVDLTALKHNYEILKTFANPATAACVLKADAYGVGVNEIALTLQKAGGNIFFTAHSFEGVEIRKILGNNPKIYVLHGCFDEDISDFKEYNLIPVVNNNLQLNLTTNAGLDYGIHVNTGMCRYSFKEPPFDAKPSLVISHLSGNQSFEQLKRFKEIIKNYKGAKVSLSASISLDLYEEYKFDIIRFGYGMYIKNSSLDLKNVLKLTAKIIQIDDMKCGDTVGYNETFVYKNKGKMATVAIGYADGFKRKQSNKGFGFIYGKKIPIIGNISMDLTTFDVSDVDNIKVGDEIEIFGDNIEIDEVAKIDETIGYEILTSLSKRYKRIYK